MMANLQVGVSRNPFDISKKSRPAFKNDRVHPNNTPGVLPTMQQARSFLQEKRTAYIQAWGTNASPPQSVVTDVATAKNAIHSLTQQQKQVFGAFLLNNLRDAVLEHRQGHTTDEVANSQAEVVRHADFQDQLDYPQQSRVMQGLAEAHTLAAGTHFNWNGVHVALGDPQHMSRTVIGIRKDLDSYPGVLKILKECKQTLNQAPCNAALQQPVRLRDVHRVLAATSPDQVEESFQQLFRHPAPDMGQEPYKKMIKELKGISFLMYALEPARDPLALVGNVLSEKLTQKGEITGRHFIHPAGRLGVLTPENISNDEKHPTVGAPMPLRPNANWQAKDAGRIDPKQKLDRNVQALKSERMQLLMQAVTNAAETRAWRPGSTPSGEDDVLFEQISLRTGLLAEAVANKDAAGIHSAGNQLRDVLTQMLGAKFQPTALEQAVKEMKKPVPDLSQIEQLIDHSLNAHRPHLVFDMAQAAQLMGKNELIVRMAGQLEQRGELFTAGRLALLQGDTDKARKLAQNLQAHHPVQAAELFIGAGQPEQAVNLVVTHLDVQPALAVSICLLPGYSNPLPERNTHGQDGIADAREILLTLIPDRIAEAVVITKQNLAKTPQLGLFVAQASFENALPDQASEIAVHAARVGRTNLAGDLCLAALSRNPIDMDCARSIVEALKGSDPVRAVQLCRNPRFVPAHFTSGDEQSEAILQHVLTTEPVLHRAAVDIALILGRRDLAMDFVSEMANNDYDDGEVFQAMQAIVHSDDAHFLACADTAYRSGREEVALELARHIESARPADAAEVYWGLNQPLDAKELVQRLVKETPPRIDEAKQVLSKFFLYRPMHEAEATSKQIKRKNGYVPNTVHYAERISAELYSHFSNQILVQPRDGVKRPRFE